MRQSLPEPAPAPAPEPHPAGPASGAGATASPPELRGRTACPVCGAHARAPDWRVQSFVYARCAGCRLAWLDPLPDRAAAAALYGRDYFRGAKGGYADYLANEELHRRNARRCLAAIARHGGRPPGRLLDVGASAGFHLDEARKLGFAVQGVDISDWARAYASERFGLEVAPGLLEVERGPHGFSVVTMLQVLEHMTDPLAALRSAHALLDPSGVLFIETWDAANVVARLAGRSWHQVNPPTVLFLFDRRNLSLLLRRAGFGVDHVRRGRKLTSAGLVAKLLAERHPRMLGRLPSLVRGLRLESAGIPYQLGDLIHVVARPRAEG